MKSAEIWAQALSQWGIPEEILCQAEQSPWIHPPALFTVPETISDTPSHEIAREILAQGDSILDVGCGGGIAAFACAPPASEVIGVDHQQEMLNLFRNHAQKLNLKHKEFLGDWPQVQDQVPKANVVTCHHVVYNVSDINPFLVALNNHATKRVVIEMPQKHPLASLEQAWKYFWNLDRPTAPTPDTLMDVLKDLGINAQIKLWQSPIRSNLDFDQAAEFLRIRLCLPKSKINEVTDFIKSNPEPKERKLATIWWNI